MNHTPVSALLAFPFKDPAWLKKLVFLTLVVLLSAVIPILPLVVIAGYLAIIVRRMVVENQPPSLPEWDDLVGIFNAGWRPLAVIVTYLLPVVVIFVVVWLMMFVPVVTLSAIPGYRGGGEVEPLSYLLFLASNFLAIAGMAVAALLALGFTFILPAAVIHAIVKQEYAAAFRIKEWWSVLAKNFSGFIVAYAVTFGINLVFGFVVQILFFTVLLCCLVPFLMLGFSSYYYLVYAALYGEAYRVGAEKLPPAPEQTLPAGEKQPKAEDAQPESPPAAEPEAPPPENPPDATLIGEPSVPPKPARKPRKPKPSAEETLVMPPPDLPSGEGPSEGAGEQAS